MNGVLAFSLEKHEWDLWIDCESTALDPLEYPLDGLILYYLTVMTGDIMIHASGMNYSGKGYLFSGVSGKGKSTMAEIWKRAGAEIIHDDILIISRKTDNSFITASTPLNGNKYSRLVKLDAVFVIGHSEKNLIETLTATKALTEILPNTVQHNYDKKIIKDHIEKLWQLVNLIPVYKLEFKPDQTVVGEIKSFLNLPS
jgi:hypothetical protein